MHDKALKTVFKSDLSNNDLAFLHREISIHQKHLGLLLKETVNLQLTVNGY